MTVLLEGNLEHISLFNLLQFVKMEQKTCGMTISIPEISQQCQMFFFQGAIRYAEVNQLRGPDAMYRIIGWWQMGTFTIRVANDAELPEANIKQPIESILLESARRIDETGGLRQKLPSITATVSFTEDAIVAVKAVDDPEHPDWIPEFLRQLPRSFSVARFFEACPLDDWTACKNLEYLLKTNALTENAVDATSGQSSAVEAYTMIVMEYVGYAEAHRIVAKSCEQTNFDQTTEAHGFMHLLNLVDAIAEFLAVTLDDDQISDATRRLRAKTTSLI
ncbi:MAG: DUF4388 domain-containing protein [Candidatus Sericytochromatia bacterium]|nr:DUF4388 domain-containing protein [Candidatus Sericytochromatia bacterium]